MELKRRRLAAPVQQSDSNRICRRLPLSGEGVVSVNIQGIEKLRIRIRPAIRDNTLQTKKEAGKEGYVEVKISKRGAIFKSKKPSSKNEEENRTAEPGQGLEEGEIVSYWLSFDRDERVLKYGKGYIMKETTLLTHSFPFPAEKEKDLDPWEFIFRPDTAKEIVVIFRRDPGGQGEQNEPSLVDMEKQVSFYSHPLKHNWPPLVLDSSKATLDILSANLFTLSASLPAICRELYENVSSPGVTLDWPYKNPRFSDVINYSLNTEGKILHMKWKEKEKKGEFQYLRVNMGLDRGSSPGVPYVLEIWPPGVSSPIHSHGNAYAVEKVLYGAIKFTIYNKTWHAEKNPKELMSFTAIQGDISWMSPNWFQTHKLTNESEKLFCATLQCYKYGQDDELMWPYFDYLKERTVDEFLPTSDFKQSFKQLRKDLFEEYRRDHLARDLSCP